jgi:DNA-binding GntR family transcriptional regulator
VYHALSKLAGEGLLDRRADGSFIVPPVTFTSLLESARARVAIFVGAAMALGDASQEEIAQLRLILETMRRHAADTFAIEAWFEARAALIDRLMRLAGGTVLLDAYQRADVPAQILALWSGARAPDRADLRAINAMHAEIIDACVSGELAVLPGAVSSLIRCYHDLYRKSLIKDNGI